jgi:hypothetical protein
LIDFGLLNRYTSLIVIKQTILGRDIYTKNRQFQRTN